MITEQEPVDDPGENLWDDDVYQVNQLTPSRPTRGQRLMHFIADIVVAVILHYVVLFGLILLFIDAGSYPEWLISGLFEQFAPLVWFILHVTFSEMLLNGQSIGKMITGYQVTNTNGTPVDAHRVLLRMAIRLIPFEMFSIFTKSGSSMWHDEWSGTELRFKQKKSARQNNVILD
ncbi:RDD family protein [Sanyastnella coralliicola]|uniref:RDD family protein n=1 Tax=Sanyastnella coralliicola TaxID=3069118 RepID=UPI0027B9484B|nr:RDD family protein [Longitalea sp. SCSIO 12813]